MECMKRGKASSREPTHQILKQQSAYGRRKTWDEAEFDLEIDGVACAHTGFQQLDKKIGVAVEYIKMADSVPTEEGACHGPMEFPHFAV